MKIELKVDSEFEKIIPPLTDGEFQQLEENILEEDRVIQAIAVWNGVIVDGHNRYKIIQKYPDIPFTTYEKYFANRYEAISWICKNQLGRRNISPEQKKYLVGQKYDAEKKAHGAADGFRGNQYNEKVVSGQNDHLPKLNKTRDKVARETKTSESYVKRADQFAKGVDAADQAIPGTRQDILIGKIKATQKEITDISKASPEDRPAMVQKLYEPKPSPQKQSKQKSGTCNGIVIGDLVADLRRPKEAMTADRMIDSLRYTAVNMVKSCDGIFHDFPELLAEKAYLSQVIDALQISKNYIIEIERKKEEHGN